MIQLINPLKEYYSTYNLSGSKFILKIISLILYYLYSNKKKFSSFMVKLVYQYIIL